MPTARPGVPLYMTCDACSHRWRWTVLAHRPSTVKKGKPVSLAAKLRRVRCPNCGEDKRLTQEHIGGRHGD